MITNYTENELADCLGHGYRVQQLGKCGLNHKSFLGASVMAQVSGPPVEN